MNIKEYQRLVTRTLVTKTPEHTMTLCLIGMLGESGEIAEPIKKHLYSGHTLDASHIQKEIGDLLWYLANLCNVIGIDIEEALSENIEKLCKRYPDGFDAERSINRVNEETENNHESRS